MSAADGAHGLGDWLDAAGFVDADLAPGDHVDSDQLDDPWGDVEFDLPTLTTAQRSFLLDGDTMTDAGSLAEADAEIIDIPGDIDDIDPFER